MRFSTMTRIVLCCSQDSYPHYKLNPSLKSTSRSREYARALIIGTSTTRR